MPDSIFQAPFLYLEMRLRLCRRVISEDVPAISYNILIKTGIPVGYPWGSTLDLCQAEEDEPMIIKEEGKEGKVEFHWRKMTLQMSLKGKAKDIVEVLGEEEVGGLGPCGHALWTCVSEASARRAREEVRPQTSSRALVWAARARTN